VAPVSLVAGGAASAASIRPALGVSRAPAIDSAVDVPDPEGPTRATTSSPATVRFASSSATNRRVTDAVALADILEDERCHRVVLLLL
jgi:hypothetical protein